MHKFFAVTALLVLLGVAGHSIANQPAVSAQAPAPAAKPAETGPAVPDALQVRILKLQRDQQGQQNQKQAIANQANSLIANIDKNIEHDQRELDMLKKEALTAMNLDPKEWDLDLDKLVAVKKPAQEEKKK